MSSSITLQENEKDGSDVGGDAGSSEAETTTLLTYSKTDETSNQSPRSTAVSIGQFEPTAAGLAVPPMFPKSSLTEENLSAHNSTIVLKQGISEIDKHQSLESLREALDSLGVELPESILFKMLHTHDYTPLYERIHMKYAMSDVEPTNHDSQDIELKAEDLLAFDEEERTRPKELSDVLQDRGRATSSTWKLSQ